MIRVLPLIFTLLATACKTATPQPSLQVFGSMRKVLRDGHDQGRIALIDLETQNAIGVGALAGLAGEVTIIDGQILVATLRDHVAVVREARTGDQATLLMVEQVAHWQHFEVGPCKNYQQLEHNIAKLLQGRGSNLRKPTPVKVTGTCTRLQAHVIAGACPIANPNGPRPWRYDGPANNVKLVGFYVEDAAGKMTHHNRSSHLHVFCDQAMGHLDNVEFTSATISIPAPIHHQ